MDIQVSIIIVNYNSESILDLCIQSILKNTLDLAYEIIVVDNNSVKGSLDNLRNKYPDIIWILSDINGGFGYANNLGNEQAQGDYLYLLNPDTELLNNAASVLTKYMESHQDVGICGGSMFNVDLTPTTSFYDIDFLTLEYQILFNIRKKYFGVNTTKEPKEVISIVGSNLFIRRNLFDCLNGFDRDFFMYFEEFELCHRVRAKGYNIMTVPDAHIMHLHGATGENKNKMLKQWLQEEHSYSKWLYLLKTKGSFSVKTLYIMSFLKISLANIFYSIKKNETKKIYWNVKNHVNKKSYKRFLEKNK